MKDAERPCCADQGAASQVSVARECGASRPHGPGAASPGSCALPCRSACEYGEIGSVGGTIVMHFAQSGLHRAPSRSTFASLALDAHRADC